MLTDSRFERDKLIEEHALKSWEIEKQWRAKKEKGECYCSEYKTFLEMHYDKPKDTMCDLCFFKLQQDEDLHFAANFLKKSWIEESIDPGP